MGRTEYGIIVTFNEEEREPQQLRYEMEIRTGKVIDDTYLMHQVDKYNVHINDRLPETVVDELAVACGNSLYPITVGINSQRQIQKVFNHADITRRWEKTRETLQAEYTGEMAEWYIARTDQCMSHPAQVLGALRQELFLHFYFHPVRLNYSSHESPPSRIQIPMVPYTPAVQYAIEERIADSDPAENSYEVSLKGSVDDQRSASDLAAGRPVPYDRHKGGEPAEGSIEIYYRMAKGRGTKKTIIANADIRLPNDQSRSVSVEAYLITN